MAISYRKKIDKLYQKRKKLEEEFQSVRNSCPHKHLYYKPCGSDGGWDYSPNYWYEFRCYDCDKMWTAPQEMRVLEKYPHAIKVYKYNSKGPTDWPEPH